MLAFLIFDQYTGHINGLNKISNWLWTNVPVVPAENTFSKKKQIYFFQIAFYFSKPSITYGNTQKGTLSVHIQKKWNLIGGHQTTNFFDIHHQYQWKKYCFGTNKTHRRHSKRKKKKKRYEWVSLLKSQQFRAVNENIGQEYESETHYDRLHWWSTESVIISLHSSPS